MDQALTIAEQIGFALCVATTLAFYGWVVAMGVRRG